MLYALLGGLLGATWLGWPGRLPGLALRAHAHLMLVGFVGLMIFGFAGHMLPRFIDAPIRGGWMAWTPQALLHTRPAVRIAALASPHLARRGQRPMT